MKRIIFSIFNDNVDQNHKSTNDYKLSQFRKFQKPLTQCKQGYADKCKADFELHMTNTTDYNTIQFEKIKLLEKYAETHDEVLYLDFDVVPTTYARPIFDHIDTNTIAMHPLRRELKHSKLKSALRLGWMDQQNVFCKTCAKKSMLLLEGINGNDHLYNTGVTLGGSEIIKRLDFTAQIPEMNELLDEAREDNVFPVEISRNFFYNNEVYISYLVERDNLPHTNLTMNWNFIMDDVQIEPTSAGELVHHVRKEFEISFGDEV